MSLEALARSMAGKLTYDSEHQNDLDGLTALAMGCITHDRRSARESLLNSLGVSLVALKIAGREDLFARCVMELKDCLRWRIPKMGQKDRLRIAKAVITEWVDDACRMCHNAKSVFDHNGVKMGCLVCAGTGKHRYSDSERSESLGVECADKWARAIGIGHFQVSFAVDYAKRNACEKLEAHAKVQPINT